MDGRIRLAGIVEFGGLDAPASRAPFRLLENNIRAAMPGLTWKESTEWMGHRPAPVGFDSIDRAGARRGRCFHGIWSPPCRLDRRAKDRSPLVTNDCRIQTKH